MAIKGIDVSHHNGTIDWNKVKNDGIEFAMIRMGFGGDSKEQDDTKFERNVKECERVGIPWGTYLYSYALSDSNVQSEIKHAMRLLKGKNPTFPIAFDMEDADRYKQKHGMPSNKKLVDFCYTWLKALEDKGYYVSLYASKSWLEGKLKSSKLDEFDKWVAQWGHKCIYNDSTYRMWQYTDDGIVDGIKGKTDLNMAYSNFRFKDKPKPQQEKHADTYKVVKTIGGFYTSNNAKKHHDRRANVTAGTYYVFSKSNGMINVTKKKGVAGSWINPSDNKKASFSVGGKVKIKSDATYYSRTDHIKIPSWAKGKSYTIEQVGKNDVLIKELYSWVSKTDAY